LIYSKQKDFLFIHIPKTAGTSIREVLSPYGGHSGIINFLARRLEKKSPQIVRSLGWDSTRTYDAHTTYLQVSEILGKNKMSSLFKFAFVRNPYARLYSFYLHILAHPEHLWYKKINAYGSFKQMLYNLDEVQEPTQKSYVIDEDGKLITDFIGRLENIEEDFKYICSKIDIDYHLPKRNSRKHKHWSEVYDQEDYKLAYNFYKEDFDLFDYPKGF